MTAFGIRESFADRLQCCRKQTSHNFRRGMTGRLWEADCPLLGVDMGKADINHWRGPEVAMRCQLARASRCGSGIPRRAHLKNSFARAANPYGQCLCNSDASDHGFARGPKAVPICSSHALPVDNRLTEVGVQSRPLEHTNSGKSGIATS